MHAGGWYRSLSRGVVLALVMCAAPLDAGAQDFPSKPVRILVGFAPGGGVDVIARLVAGKLSAMWGQPVVVENRPGASGMIAADMVAKAPPDGHLVIVSVPNSHTLGPHLLKAPYDALRDFTPITMAARVPMILVVGNSVGVNSMQELVQLAKANRGDLTFGSSGMGSIQQIGGETFNQLTGAKVVHVPYKGSAAALVDVMSGTITMSFDTSSGAMGYIRGGKLKALAVLAPGRLGMLPNVPTTAEAGFPGFELSVWYGFSGPPALPKAIVDKWQGDIAKALQMPDVRERIEQFGGEPIGNRPEEFKAFYDREYQRMGTLVKEAGIRAE